MKIYSRSGLVELEAVLLADTNERNPDLARELEDFGPPAGFVDNEIDLVLMSACLGLLQEADEGRALIYAHRDLDRDPNRADLLRLTNGFPRTYQRVPGDVSAIRSRVVNYVRNKGCGGNENEAEVAYCCLMDAHLDRVSRGLVHPILGMKCAGATANAFSEPEWNDRAILGPRLIGVCSRIDWLWMARLGDTLELERWAFNIAQNWTNGRLISTQSPSSFGKA